MDQSSPTILPCQCGLQMSTAIEVKSAFKHFDYILINDFIRGRLSISFISAYEICIVEVRLMLVVIIR